MEIDYQSLGKRIRLSRYKLRYSQEYLARSAKVSTSYLSHIENGTAKISLAAIFQIANALHCTIDTLLADSWKIAFPLFQYDIHQELQDCSREELAVMEDMIRALKSSLRRSRNQTDS